MDKDYQSDSENEQRSQPYEKEYGFDELVNDFQSEQDNQNNDEQEYEVQADNNENNDDNDDNPDEEDYELEEMVTSKRKPQVQIEKKKHKKLRKTREVKDKVPKYNDDDIGSIHDENEERANEAEQDHVAQVINAVKQKKKSKKGLDQDQIEVECQRILELLEEAYDADIQSNLQKRPAIKKLKVVDEIYKGLQQLTIQEEFIEKNGLDLLAKWVQKMPDGSRPSQALKCKVLTILNMLQLEGSQIPTDSIGKFLNSIYRNESKTETQQMMALSKQIIDKWTRNLSDNIIDYQRVDYDDIDIINRKRQKRRQQQEEEQKIDVFKQSQQNERYVRVPISKNFDFYQNAQSNITDDMRPKEISQKSKDIYRMLQHIKGKRKSNF